MSASCAGWCRSATASRWTASRATSGELVTFFRGPAHVRLHQGPHPVRGLLVLGIGFALPIALACGVLSLVPFVGFIVGVVPASVIALTMDNGGTEMRCGSWACSAPPEAFEGFCALPRRAGPGTGLHAVTIVVVLPSEAARSSARWACSSASAGAHLQVLWRELGQPLLPRVADPLRRLDPRRADETAGSVRPLAERPDAHVRPARGRPDWPRGFPCRCPAPRLNGAVDVRYRHDAAKLCAVKRVACLGSKFLREGARQVLPVPAGAEASRWSGPISLVAEPRRIVGDRGAGARARGRGARSWWRPNGPLDRPLGDRTCSSDRLARGRGGRWGFIRRS